MGLYLASSKKKSRDLHDSRADDSYPHHNGSVGRVGNGHTRRNPVRLLSSRSLLTPDLCRLTTHGRTVGDGSVEHAYTVSQNGRGDGSGQAELTRLLVETQPTCRWQEPLKHLLMSYLMPKEAESALSFLAQIMNTAYEAVQNPSQSLGYPALYIDITDKPVVFGLDFWKKIMMALHFDLTEPEGNRHLDLIEVKVTNYVTLPPLVGFKMLLHSLSDLSWEMRRMVLALTPEEALSLLAVLQLVLRCKEPQDHQCLHNLHARYPDQLCTLGFNVITSSRHSDVRWTQPPSHDVIHNVEVALIGLYHDGSGLETYI